VPLKTNWGEASRSSNGGTPGMGVIFMGCKSPVRDWESQGVHHTK
jgi:hypothetical protein